MELREIEKNYERMSDNRLIEVITTNAQGIQPEVVSIIENEIKKRNLDPDLLNSLIAQNEQHSIEDIYHYAELLRNCPCPICNNTRDKLNGTIYHSIKSIIVMSITETRWVIACPDCLDKQNRKAIVSCSLLGWWGIPWGILKTPVYIYRNLKVKGENRISDPNGPLLSFTADNIGQIKAFENNPEKLKNVIKDLR
ncbi:hypothetical protein BV902_17515 [Sphingobacterium sp. B29]|jgi:hypothetical protein|nr:hypothetical protein BV902_17515 [Sphingobacterium sp. B29]